jgi:hypothetical protein
VPRIFRPRGVLGGAVLVAVGTAFLLPPLGVRNAGSYLFVALGLAFAAAYFLGTRQYIYLVPAGVLLGFGLGLVLPEMLNVQAAAAAPVFFASLGAGLVVVYLLAPTRRWPLVPAAVFAVLAILGAFNQVALIPNQVQPYLVPLILIAVGAYLILEPRAD